MNTPQTESSDMRIWEQEWRLRSPLNIPILAKDAPDNFTDLRNVEPLEALPGDFSLDLLRRVRSIDPAAHETLLQKSLQEYGEIWRTLAER